MSPAPSLERVVIEPYQASVARNLSDVWRHRRLMGFLFKRFAKSFYRGTALGAGWILIRALVPAFAGALVFGGIAKIPTGELPYLLFFFSGMCLWNLFANSMRILTRSLKIGRRLVINLSFPRILLPIASLSIFLIELGVNLLLFVAIVIYEGAISGKMPFAFRPAFLLAPVYILAVFLWTLGIGFFTSVLNTRTRDVRFSVPYFVQLFFLATPVFYPLSAVPEKWRWLIALNPLAGILEGFRWSLFDAAEAAPLLQVYSLSAVGAVFLGGVWFFTKAEATLSDYL